MRNTSKKYLKAFPKLISIFLTLLLCFSSISSAYAVSITVSKSGWIDQRYTITGHSELNGNTSFDSINGHSIFYSPDGYQIYCANPFASTPYLGTYSGENCTLSQSQKNHMGAAIYYYDHKSGLSGDNLVHHKAYFIWWYLKDKPAYNNKSMYSITSMNINPRSSLDYHKNKANAYAKQHASEFETKAYILYKGNKNQQPLLAIDPNYQPYGYAKVKKTTSSKGYSLMKKYPAYYKLSDAVFWVYDTEAHAKARGKAGYIDRLVTDSNGVTNSCKLKAGTYYVTEGYKPKGFELNKDTKAITVKSGETTTVSFADYPEDTGKGVVQKRTSDRGRELVKKYPEYYSLEGAVFWVYDTKAHAKARGDAGYIARMVTNEDGITPETPLPVGDYYVVEGHAPKGFELNPAIASIDIRPGVKSTIKFLDEPKTVGYGVVQKRTSERGLELMKKYPAYYKLSGAVFWVYDTKEHAKARGDAGYIARMVTNEDGVTPETKLPVGDYYIVEGYAPKGFEINPAIAAIDIRPNIKSTVKFLDVPTTTGYGKVQKRTLDRGLELLKKYPKEYSLEGAVFWVYDTEAHAKARGDAGYITRMVTDKNGTTPETKLPVGDYYIVEGYAPKGFKLNPDITSIDIRPNFKSTVKFLDVPKDRGKAKVEKTTSPDAKLAKLCPEGYSLKNAVFWVYDNEKNARKGGSEGYLGRLVTDENGKTSTIDLMEGDYVMIEGHAPKGHKLSKEVKKFTVNANKTTTVSFTDPPVLDPLNWNIVSKKIEKNSNPNLSVKGAEFTVKYYNTLGSISGKKPTKTWTFLADEKGQVRWRDSYLKTGSEPLFKNSKNRETGLIGTYTINETNAPKGLAKDNRTIYVKIEQNGAVPKRTYSDKATFENPVSLTDKGTAWNLTEKVQKADLEINKIDAETGKNVAQGYGSLAGATYEVFKYTPFHSDDKKVGEITTDKDGKGSLKGLEFGYYKINEKSASNGYLLDPETHKVEARLAGPNTAVFTYTTTSKEKPTTIEILKTGLGTNSTKDYPKGSVLELRDSKGKVLEKWTTDGKAHVIKGLSVGEKYSIYETKTPEGYIGLEKAYTFTVEDTNKAQSHEVFNEPVPTIKTHALFDTNVSSTLPKDDVKLIDTIKYDKVLKGHPYTFKGKLVDVKDPSKVIAEGKTTFTPTASSGEIKVEYKFDASHLEGTTMVVTEKLYRDDKEGDKLVATHENLNDKEQTTSVLKIHTTATDKIDGKKDVFANKEVTVKDKVSYTNVLVGHTYKVTGKLMNKKTGKPILSNGKEVTAEKTFTAEKTEGFVELEFTFNASSLKGERVVAFEKVYEKNIEVGTHTDINDEDQTVDFPETTTSAVSQEDYTKSVLPVKKATVRDTVKFKLLTKGQVYTVKGQLVNKKSGEVLTTAEGAFKAEDRNGKVDLDFTFDASKLRGEEVVAFEQVYRADNKNGEDQKLVAEHKDINDKDQTVKILNPKGKTDAKSNDKIKSVLPVKEATVNDTLSYTDLIAGKEYTVKGQLVRKSDKAVIAENTVTFKAEGKAGEVVSGSVKIPFTFDASKLRGEEVVAFERLSYGDEDIIIHEDIDDKDQTVKVLNPKGKTDAKTSDNIKSALPLREIKVNDTLSYTDLIAGKEYTAEGKIVRKSDKAVIAENTVKFKPEGKDGEVVSGSVEIPFTFDARKLRDSEIVAFEKVKYGDEYIIIHEDINDKDQTVKVENPEGKTEAKTNDNLKTALPVKELTIVDNLAYTNLIAGKEYTAEGQLVRKSDKAVIVKNTVNFKPEGKDGEVVNGNVEIPFTFDASKLKGEEVVAFEKIKYGDDYIVIHEDINDKDQTVKVENPEGKTEAKTNDNLKTALPLKEIKVNDTLSYTNLIAGKEYTAEGQLVRKSDKAVIAKNTVKFKPEGKDGEVVSGSVEIPFKFDASKLRGEDVVAFEKIKYGDDYIVIHVDINDKDQTVKIVPPEGKTEARSDDGTKSVLPVKDVTIVDNLTFTNLIAGREYTAEGKLVRKSDKAVIAKKNVTFKPEGKDGELVNGSVKIPFTFDASKLRGEEVVAFEKIKYGDDYIVIHEDINDKDQTVKVENPQTNSKALFGNGKKAIMAAENIKVIDKVNYKNLVPGKKYSIKGILMDKVTRKPFVINGKAVTAKTEFVAKDSEGQVDQVFNFDGKKAKNATIVAFEDISYKGESIVSHKDINSRSQTVTLLERKVTKVPSGDNTSLARYALLMIVILALGTLLTVIKRR